MPRGGRRPGAGAPKGNFNALTTGNNSVRLLMVYLRIAQLFADRDHPGRADLGRWLLEGGFVSPPRYRYNEDIQGAMRFLWYKWFDCFDAKQSNSIKDLPVVHHPRPSERARQLRKRAEQQRLLRKAKKWLNNK